MASSNASSSPACVTANGQDCPAIFNFSLQTEHQPASFDVEFEITSDTESLGSSTTAKTYAMFPHSGTQQIKVRKKASLKNGETNQISPQIAPNFATDNTTFVPFAFKSASKLNQKKSSRPRQNNFGFNFRTHLRTTQLR